MLFERFDAKGIAQHSYAVGCHKVGKLLIVDPCRDVDHYLNFAKENKMQISHILETHIPADYVSGAKDLAMKTGAELCLSAYDSGETFEVSFPHTQIYEGDKLEIGQIVLEAVHTPGISPEHISYLVYDCLRSKELPALMLTGDFLLVGSVGRTDVNRDDDKRSAAEKLFHSLREKLKSLPDSLEIYPSHSGGSLCAKGISKKPSSTLGYERAVNPYLDESLTEREFVDKILRSFSPLPQYYQRMKLQNSEGAPALHALPGLKAIDVERFHWLVNSGHIVIDIRDESAFAAGHIPGSFGIGASSVVGNWAGWVLPYETSILLVTEDPDKVRDAVRSLVRVGFDQIEGYLNGGIEAWEQGEYEIKALPWINPEELNKSPQNKVLDVRGAEEWETGHIKGSLNFPGGQIGEHLDDLGDRKLEITVVCGGGYRATVAASVLQREGFTNVSLLSGGMKGWKKLGLPIDTEVSAVVGSSQEVVRT
ncbi:MAG: hydroxyacylglutathione hydrolase [Chlamydiales bacterium]|jgi:hydroxyacylglutathione hydrolase